MSGRKLFGWDSCIMLAYIKGEVRENPDELLGIREMVRLFDQGEIGIVVSTLMYVEVLEGTTANTINNTDAAEEASQRFLNLEERENFHVINVTTEVAKTAHTIRDYYVQRGTTVRVADAIHVATSIIERCDAFYTFDGTNPNHGGGLLVLSSPLAGQFEMPILNPETFGRGQLSLGLSSSV